LRPKKKRRTTHADAECKCFLFTALLIIIDGGVTAYTIDMDNLSKMKVIESIMLSFFLGFVNIMYLVQCACPCGLLSHFLAHIRVNA